MRTTEERAGVQNLAGNWMRMPADVRRLHRLAMRFGKAKGPPRAPEGARTSGTIARIAVGQGHGFIRLRDRREVFFHRADLDDDTSFNSLRHGDLVTFELIVDVISGPRAVCVTRRRGDLSGKAQ